MNTLKLTDEEARELAFEGEIIEGESGRWTQSMTTIIEKDGKFYAMDWEQGLTENQENEIEGGEFPEVFKTTKTIVETSWTTTKPKQ